MKLGAQLYTVRNFTQSLNAFDDTLARIADIGYQYIQVSGTCDYEPQWLADALKKHGLACVLTHIDPNKIEHDAESVVREHAIFNCSNIGIGGMPFELRGSLEGLKSFYDRFHSSAVSIKKHGAKLFYHNHAFEFQRIDGKPILMHLADMFSPDELSITLDTYWVQAGGADAADYIRRLAGRVECIHLKDMAANRDNSSTMCPIYEGNMDFDAIIDAAQDSGCEYALIEQDDCYGENPFDCLKRSFDNIISRYPDMR